MAEQQRRYSGHGRWHAGRVASVCPRWADCSPRLGPPRGLLSSSETRRRKPAPLGRWCRRRHCPLGRRGVLLYECESRLRPRWVCAEGFVRSCLGGPGGRREGLRRGRAHVVRKGGPLGAFRSIRYPLIGRVLERRDVTAAAQACMKTRIGHVVVPHRRGMSGDWVPIHKGCKQGAPESPVLCNARPA